MTCDFSDAERIGVERAIRTHYNIAEDLPIILERHYRFWHVHFKRSLTRVRVNGVIVPPAKEMYFYYAVLELLDPNLTKGEFDDLVSSIQHDYEGTKK